MKRFRGTDVGLGVLAIAVNVALVVALVLWGSGRNDEPSLPTSAATPTPTASASSASPSSSPTPSVRGAAAVLARTSPTTIAVLGDQTSDGTNEWVAIFAELLGRNREVTLHQLDPQDPTVYANEQVYGSSGPEVAIYNGSRAEAGADYAAKRLAFLVPRKPDLVVLNYGRNDSADVVAARLTATTAAVRKAWSGAVIVVTLQPPTVGDSSKELRDGVTAWAKQSGVQTLNVAKGFIDTGEPNDYVSARDQSAMTANGDRLWGRTAYRLLVGSDPPPLPQPTPVETTEPSPQPSTTTPTIPTTPTTRPRTRTTAPPNTTSAPTTRVPSPTTSEPQATTSSEPTPTFTRRPTASPTPTPTGGTPTPPEQDTSEGPGEGTPTP